jgi:positive regulator of sigma E activity
VRTAARVTEVLDGRARLTCDRAPACGACAGSRGCALRWLVPAGESILEVSAVAAHGVALEAGQPVTVEVADGELQRAAARLYLPPLAGLVGGPLLAFGAFGAGDGVALAAAAGGMILGWTAARGWVRRSPPGFTVHAGADP